MSKRREPLVVELIRAHGVGNAFRAATFIVSWAIAEDATRAEGPLSLTRYSEWWGQSRTTTWREQRSFEMCYPGQRTPEGVVAGLRLVVPEGGTAGYIRAQVTAQVFGAVA